MIRIVEVYLNPINPKTLNSDGTGVFRIVEVCPAGFQVLPPEASVDVDGMSRLGPTTGFAMPFCGLGFRV